MLKATSTSRPLMSFIVTTMRENGGTLPHHLVDNPFTLLMRLVEEETATSPS